MGCCEGNNDVRLFLIFNTNIKILIKEKLLYFFK